MTDDERVAGLLSRWEGLRSRGQAVTAADLCDDHPELLTTVSLALARRLAETAEVSFGRVGPSSETMDAPRDEDRDGDGLTDAFRPPKDDGELGRLGPFRVLKLLGMGGMGAVFLALDPQLGRSVALKVMRPRLAGDPTARERFLREARAAAALEHDHIVSIYQVGEDEGVPYLAMPLLRGTSLDERLKTGPPLSGAEVVRIGREIAEGLAAAHARGLVHRDIKPANLWLEEGTGRVKILDFGLARAAHELDRLTQDGTILGTPAYMAPEQASGSAAIDERCDLYSLGSILYRLATGRPPFRAASVAELLVRVVRETPEPPSRHNPEILPALNDLIMGLMARDPAARPASARAVADALRALERPQEWATPLPEIDVGVEASGSLWMPPRPRPRGRGRLGSVLATLALAAVVVGALSQYSWLRDLATDRGRLVLASPSPDGFVAVRQEGRMVALLRPNASSPVRLKAGAYSLELSDATALLRLAADRVEVRRGELAVVRVVAAPFPAARPSQALMAPWWRVPTTRWPEPPLDDDWPAGIVSRPACRPGAPRWQVETRWPRGPVHSVSLSPDGKRLAAAGDDRVVRIYETGRLDLAGVLVGHTAQVFAVAWCPDGTRLATAGDDATVRLWKADGAPSDVLHGHEARIQTLAWSRDGARLASGDTAGAVRVWGADGAPLLNLPQFAPVSAVAWHPDGRWLTAASGTAVRFWDASGQPGPVLNHPVDVLALAWSPVDARLATGTRSGAEVLRFWEADGTPGPVVKNNDSFMRSLAWSPDGARLACAVNPFAVRVYSAEGAPGPLVATTGPIHSLDWSVDGARLAGGGPESLRLWTADLREIRTKAEIAGFGPDHRAAANPSGTRFASVRGASRGVLIWEAEGGREVVLKGHSAPITAVAWSRDGTRLASADMDRNLRLWAADGTPGPILVGHAGSIRALAWAPGGLRLASGDDGGSVRLWAADGTPGLILNADKARIIELSWSPDGARLTATGHDGAHRMWRADGTPLVDEYKLPPIAPPILASSWNRGLSRHAVTGGENVVNLVDSFGRAAPRGAPLGYYPSALAWHPDDERLAGGDSRACVVLLDVLGNIGPTLRIDRAPTMGTTSLMWNEEGTRLVGASRSGLTRAWNGRTLANEWVAYQPTPSEVVVFSDAGAVLHASPGALKHVVILVERPDGGVTLLTREEFERAGR